MVFLSLKLHYLIILVPMIPRFVYYYNTYYYVIIFEIFTPTIPHFVLFIVITSIIVCTNKFGFHIEVSMPRDSFLLAHKSLKYTNSPEIWVVLNIHFFSCDFTQCTHVTMYTSHLWCYLIDTLECGLLIYYMSADILSWVGYIRHTIMPYATLR